MMRLLIPLVFLLALPSLAQESASFKLGEHAFNAGGHPADGAVLESASFKITLDAIGDSVTGATISSSSYYMEGSFVGRYPPPGEVMNLLFTNPNVLAWDHERSAGNYNLYRDLVTELPGSGYGICERQQIPDSTTPVNDSHELDAESSFFYLITVENRLNEEGTKGTDSDATVRMGNICP